MSHTDRRTWHRWPFWMAICRDDWENEWTDIDLPFVISKKKNLENLCYKNDFTNIILVFDYERHDPQFSADKILRLQNYFSDANFRLIA